MKHPFFHLLFSLTLALSVGAHAEKADSNKPIDIEADQSDYDNVKQTQTMTGNVLIKRGTLEMKAAKAILRKDANGNQLATLLATPGGLTSFRQKQDGGDLWIEGHAERIEYDSKAEQVKLFLKAKLKRREGAKTMDEMEGECIYYDSHSQFLKVNNAANCESKAGAGRIKIVIQPQTETKSN